MTNRLKAYTRRTILTAAKEYAYPKARKPRTLADYRREHDGGPAECTIIGLRFAVEWYASEIARELCPDF